MADLETFQRKLFFAAAIKKRARESNAKGATAGLDARLEDCNRARLNALKIKKQPILADRGDDDTLMFFPHRYDVDTKVGEACPAAPAPARLSGLLFSAVKLLFWIFRSVTWAFGRSKNG